MTAALPEYIEFAPDEPVEVLDRVRQLQLDRGGWLNFQPALDPELIAAGSHRGPFSARGPDIPLATWTLGRVSVGRRDEPAAVGIQHGTGPKVVPRLLELATPVPHGWKVLQDHPKRGLVVEVGSGVPAADTLRWLLEATAVLCPVPFERWLAQVHTAR